MRYRLERVPSLLLDIDTGADLAALRERLVRHRERAACTRAVLAAHSDPEHPAIASFA